MKTLLATKSQRTLSESDPSSLHQTKVRQRTKMQEGKGREGGTRAKEERDGRVNEGGDNDNGVRSKQSTCHGVKSPKTRRDGLASVHYVPAPHAILEAIVSTPRCFEIKLMKPSGL